MNNKRTIPFMQQSLSKRNCGAACLGMLLQSYKMKGKLQEITDSVSQDNCNGVKYCNNDLIIGYAISRGLNCSVISAKCVKDLIMSCLDNNIEVFVLYHIEENSPAGHFSIVSYAGDDYVYVNDPSKPQMEGQNCKLTFDFLERRMKKISLENGIIDEIAKDNTFILFSKEKDEDVLVHNEVEDGKVIYSKFDAVEGYVDYYRDPYHGKWVPNG